MSETERGVGRGSNDNACTVIFLYCDVTTNWSRYDFDSGRKEELEVLEQSDTTIPLVRGFAFEGSKVRSQLSGFEQVVVQ